MVARQSGFYDVTTIRDEIRGYVYMYSWEVLTLLGIDPDLPAEWATVDRCLEWLSERGYLPGINLRTDGVWVVVFDGFKWDSHHEPTLHGALIAACRAVQEAQPACPLNCGCTCGVCHDGFHSGILRANNGGHTAACMNGMAVKEAQP
jgi:hypothetical protein